MAKILGTNLSAPVTPYTDADLYSTHIDIYGKGGWREVGTYTDLELIPEPRKSIGMAVYVIDEGNLYILKSSGWDKFSAGSGSTYIYETNVSTAETDNQWKITHNLGKFPSVTVVDTSNREVIGDVEYVSNNELIVHFSPTSPLEKGKAYLN